MGELNGRIEELRARVESLETQSQNLRRVVVLLVANAADHRGILKTCLDLDQRMENARLSRDDQEWFRLRDQRAAVMISGNTLLLTQAEATLKLAQDLGVIAETQPAGDAGETVQGEEECLKR